MRSNLRCIFLLTLLAFSTLVMRPAIAQEPPPPPTPREIYGLIIEGINAGYFKCSVRTVLQLLQLAESADCPRKLQLLLLARECLCGPSREIDNRPGSPTQGQPYQTLGPGIYDLANFQHTVAAQTFGRRLCELLNTLIATACPL